MHTVFTTARVVFDVTLAAFGLATLGRRGGVLFGFVAGGASLSVSELSSEDSELVLSSILEDVAPSLIGSVDEAMAVSKDTMAMKESVTVKLECAVMQCYVGGSGGHALDRTSTSSKHGSRVALPRWVQHRHVRSFANCLHNKNETAEWPPWCSSFSNL